MNQTICVETLLRELKSSRFVLECKMAMGYTPGLPILQIRKDQLCLLVPFLKYKITGKPDKTLVYPIRYTVTVLLPEKKILAFSDLSFDRRFSSVQFDKPAGLFRHEAIQDLTRPQYRALRQELLQEYDRVAKALLFGEPYCAEDEKRMGALLRQLLEPSLLPLMRTLDMEFCRKYDL